jgi:hypothetical protein
LIICVLGAVLTKFQISNFNTPPLPAKIHKSHYFFAFSLTKIRVKTNSFISGKSFYYQGSPSVSLKSDKTVTVTAFGKISKIPDLRQR